MAESLMRFRFIMKDILNKILAKRGLTIEQLDKEEAEQFEQWQSVLTKDELTTKDIKDFCQNMVDVINGKWQDLNTEQSKKAELIPYHTCYKLLLAAIDSPKSSRDALEKNLVQLIQ